MRTLDRDPTDLGLPRLPESPDNAPHECRNGWTGDEDMPRPCPACRPHLAHRPDGWHLDRTALPPRPHRRRKAAA